MAGSIDIASEGAEPSTAILQNWLVGCTASLIFGRFLLSIWSVLSLQSAFRIVLLWTAFSDFRRPSSTLLLTDGSERMLLSSGDAHARREWRDAASSAIPESAPATGPSDAAPPSVHDADASAGQREWTGEDNCFVRRRSEMAI